MQSSLFKNPRSEIITGDQPIKTYINKGTYNISLPINDDNFQKIPAENNIDIPIKNENLSQFMGLSMSHPTDTYNLSIDSYSFEINGCIYVLGKILSKNTYELIGQNHISNDFLILKQVILQKDTSLNKLNHLISIDHPNLAKIYKIHMKNKESDLLPQKAYIITHKYDLNLTNFLCDLDLKNPQDYQIFNLVFQGIMTMIKELRSLGYIHPNLKPENIFIVNNTKVIISDYFYEDILNQNLLRQKIDSKFQHPEYRIHLRKNTCVEIFEKDINKYWQYNVAMIFINFYCIKNGIYFDDFDNKNLVKGLEILKKDTNDEFVHKIGNIIGIELYTSKNEGLYQRKIQLENGIPSDSTKASMYKKRDTIHPVEEVDLLLESSSANIFKNERLDLNLQNDFPTIIAGTKDDNNQNNSVLDDQSKDINKTSKNSMDQGLILNEKRLLIKSRPSKKAIHSSADNSPRNIAIHSYIQENLDKQKFNILAPLKPNGNLNRSFRVNTKKIPPLQKINHQNKQLEILNTSINFIDDNYNINASLTAKKSKLKFTNNYKNTIIPIDIDNSLNKSTINDNFYLNRSNEGILDKQTILKNKARNIAHDSIIKFHETNQNIRDDQSSYPKIDEIISQYKRRSGNIKTKKSKVDQHIEEDKLQKLRELTYNEKNRICTIDSLDASQSDIDSSNFIDRKVSMFSTNYDCEKVNKIKADNYENTTNMAESKISKEKMLPKVVNKHCIKSENKKIDLMVTLKTSKIKNQDAKNTESYEIVIPEQESSSDNILMNANETFTENKLIIESDLKFKEDSDQRALSPKKFNISQNIKRNNDYVACEFLKEKKEDKNLNINYEKLNKENNNDKLTDSIDDFKNPNIQGNKIRHYFVRKEITNDHSKIEIIQPDIPIDSEKKPTPYRTIKKYLYDLLKNKKIIKTNGENIIINDPAIKDNYYILHAKNASLIYYGQINDKGHKHGTGRFYQKNEVYYGDFTTNLKHGKGKYYYSNNEHYEGQWFQDLRHGEGTLYYDDNKIKMSGIWKNGNLEGIGTFHFDDGRIYEGEFNSGKFHGAGIIFHDNCKPFFEGIWKNGKKHGKFRIFNKEGILLREVDYENDKEIPKPLTRHKRTFTIQLQEVEMDEIAKKPSTPEITNNSMSLETNSLQSSSSHDSDFNIKDSNTDILAGITSNTVNFYLNHLRIEHETFYSDQQNIRGLSYYVSPDFNRILIIEDRLLSLSTNGTLNPMDWNYQAISHMYKRYTGKSFTIFDLYDRIFFLTKDKENNWALAEINCSHKEKFEFIVYDPNKESKFKNNICLALCKYAENEIKQRCLENQEDYKLYMSKIGNSEFIIADIKKVENNSDSGIFILGLLKNIILNEDIQIQDMSIQKIKNEIRLKTLDNYFR